MGKGNMGEELGVVLAFADDLAIVTREICKLQRLIERLGWRAIRARNEEEQKKNGGFESDDWTEKSWSGCELCDVEKGRKI